MLVRQGADPNLAQFACLVGCPRSGEAIVIDPERDVDRDFDVAARAVGVGKTYSVQ
jgi:hydroxyacylglutathione hydrolase